MKILTRDKVSSDRKWALNDILNEEEIPSIFETVRKNIPAITAFNKKLNEDNAIDCLTLHSKTLFLIEKLIVYVNMKDDEDKSITKYQELYDQAIQLYVEFSTATSFISPAISSFSLDTLKKLKNNPKYSNYSRYFENIIRKKKHILSAKEEKLLSQVGSFAGDFKDIFSFFDNVDIDLGTINVRGEKVKLTHGSYAVLLRDSDQKVRKKAFDSLYKAYKSMINTIAATYIGNVKATCFYAKTRKYKSSLDMALSGSNIPSIVYDNLIASVKKYTPVMHKYVALRKKALNLSRMHMYDMYTPIVKDIDKLITYDKAYDIVIEGLAPLGQEYKEILLKAKNEGWIDVEETKAKRSGAYSSSIYGTHPYILLNHKGTISDMFTIAHELGHAVHSYKSNNAQCYEKASYTIFVAEIASTVNEVLLIKHLLKEAKGQERIYLLSYYIDMIRTTLFRQTMFAEFERYAHDEIEEGRSLSAEKLTKFYHNLNSAYYGKAVVNDDLIGYEWSRIPHFYNDFYVYQYATGITCAINIANAILKDNSIVEKYNEFLSAGGSLDSLDIIKIMGIDLTNKAPFEVAMKEFRSLQEELDLLIGRE
ncbi:MAG: oligoendopeptidase F [Clostridiales bacterium]|nr:oligoendopeptidase F [Clostridiales bacterium]